MLLDARPRLWGLLVADLLLCGMVGPEAYGEGSTTDRALILHYTFDKDTGDTAKDRSAYGNDGKIVKAEYLEEFDGRRGVLRFDGEESVLNCPDSESLHFGGDMSFEMWARLNGPMKDISGMIFGDRNNYALHMGYWHTLEFVYYRLNVELRAGEPMAVPLYLRFVHAVADAGTPLQSLRKQTSRCFCEYSSFQKSILG